jgi:hypothetical protein
MSRRTDRRERAWLVVDVADRRRIVSCSDMATVVAKLVVPRAAMKVATVLKVEAVLAATAEVRVEAAVAAASAASAVRAVGRRCTSS